MAGGIGSRFWPFSRADKPKQFLDLLNLGKTMMQLAYDRFARILPETNIFIVTQKEYVGLVQEQLPQLSQRQIIAEPVSLGTAPSVALASATAFEDAS